MSNSLPPVAIVPARAMLRVLSAATMMIIGIAATGCQKRVPQAPTPEEIQAQARASIEKAMAEDRARVEASRTETPEETRRFAEQRAANEKRREEARLRAEAENAKRAEIERQEQEKAAAMAREKAQKEAKQQAEITAAEQKVRELDARNLQFGAEARTKFEQWILEDVKERKESSVVAIVELESRGGDETRYKVELRAPRFEIWPADLEAERARLSTADRLNGKLADLEWRGFAFVDAAAYRVLEKRVEEARNMVRLIPSRKPAYEDGAWHDARSHQRLPLPLVGAYKIEKTAQGWSIEEVDGLTKDRFLDDWRSNRERMQVPGGPRLPVPTPKLVAEAALSLQPVQGVATAAESGVLEAAKAEFEKYVIRRTSESLTLRSEERASKITIRSLSESPYYTERRTTEYHAPVVTVEPMQLSDADRLNGVEWRGKVSLKADSYRIVEISPEPEKRTVLEDGRWQSSYGAEEFVLTRKAGEWSLALARPRDEYRLLKRE